MIAVARNGKPMLTPAGRPIEVPTQALADAIAAEWVNVKGLVRRDQIPFTQYANTAIDHAAQSPDAMVAGFLSHAESDMLCFRAEQPKALADRQQVEWQPLLDWAKETHGVELFVFTGLLHMKQDQDGIRRLREIAKAMTPFELLALSQAAGLLGSAVLALALVTGRLDHATALRLSLLEELFQSEEWGVPEEMKERRDDLALELAELDRFIRLIKAA